MYPTSNKAVQGWYVWRAKGDSFYISGPAKPRIGSAVEDGPHGPYGKEQAERFKNEINGRAVVKCN